MNQANGFKSFVNTFCTFKSEVRNFINLKKKE